MKNKHKKTDLEQLKDYVEFLKKRLNSTNFKANVSAEEYAETKKKYDKAKFRLKMFG